MQSFDKGGLDDLSRSLATRAQPSDRFGAGGMILVGLVRLRVLQIWRSTGGLGIANVHELETLRAWRTRANSRVDWSGRLSLVERKRGLIVDCKGSCSCRKSNWTYSPLRRGVRSGDVRGSLREWGSWTPRALLSGRPGVTLVSRFVSYTFLYRVSNR